MTFTTSEFDLLACFVQRPRRVLTRDQLLDWTRGRAAEPFDRSVDMLVSKLRKSSMRQALARPDNHCPQRRLFAHLHGQAALDMTRLTLAMRLSLILVLSISAIWLVAVALYYRSVPSSLERAKPSSERLAAIAELLETTPNERRGLVLAALTTDAFAPRLESLEDALDATAARPKPKLFRDAALEEFYVKGLGGTGRLLRASSAERRVVLAPHRQRPAQRA